MQPAATCNKANAISNPKNGISLQMLSLHVGTACQPVDNHPLVKLLLGSTVVDLQGMGFIGTGLDYIVLLVIILS